MIRCLISIRALFLTVVLISTAVISNPVFARISIGYHGGHYGHGYGYNYGHRYYNRHYYYPYNSYRKYNYYRPYKYSKPYSYSDKNYSQPSSSDSDTAPSKQHKSNDNNDAWTKLVNGNEQSALAQFSNEAQSNPKAGIPKAGFALAAATSGDLDKGVWAMRRAFQYDPASLNQLAKDSRLQHTLDDLIEKYEYTLQHNGSHQDEAFMVSALNYLKGDYAAAEKAATLAEKDGDRSKSFKNLQQLLTSAKP